MEGKQQINALTGKSSLRLLLFIRIIRLFSHTESPKRTRKKRDSSSYSNHKKVKSRAATWCPKLFSASSGLFFAQSSYFSSPPFLVILCLKASNVCPLQCLRSHQAHAMLNEASSNMTTPPLEPYSIVREGTPPCQMPMTPECAGGGGVKGVGGAPWGPADILGTAELEAHRTHPTANHFPTSRLGQGLET